MATRWRKYFLAFLFAGLAFWWTCKNESESIVGPAATTGDLRLVMGRPAVSGATHSSPDLEAALSRETARLVKARLQISGAGMDPQEFSQAVNDSASTISCLIKDLPVGKDRLVKAFLYDGADSLRFYGEALTTIIAAKENSCEIKLGGIGLNILTPRTGATLYQRRITLSGVVTGIGDSLLTLTINNQTLYVQPSGGSFRTDLVLLKGLNTIKVEDVTGHSDQIEVTADIEPVDLLVLLSWDYSCDLDLHVINPAGERCSVHQMQTASGGRMLNTVAAGYGPECYIVPSGKLQSGTYRIEVNFAQGAVPPGGTVNAYVQIVWRENGSTQTQLLGPLHLYESYRQNAPDGSHSPSWLTGIQVDGSTGTVTRTSNTKPVWTRPAAETTFVFAQADTTSSIAILIQDADKDQRFNTVQPVTIVPKPQTDFLSAVMQADGHGRLEVDRRTAPVGTYIIELINSDNGMPALADTLIFYIAIQPTLRRPVIAMDKIFPLSVLENANDGGGETVLFTFTDENYDELEVLFTPDPEIKFGFDLARTTEADKPGLVRRQLLIKPDFDVTSNQENTKIFANNRLIVREKKVNPLADTLLFTIRIENVNRPPYFKEPPTKPVTYQRGDLVTLDFKGFDPDGDKLTFRAEKLPDSVRIDPTTGIISGKVATDSSITSIIYVSDSVAPDVMISLSWSISGMGPVVRFPESTLHFKEGERIRVAVSADDREGGVITFFPPTGLPDSLGYTTKGDSLIIKGKLSRTSASHSPYAVKVLASDPENHISLGTAIFVITNPGPKLGPLADANYSEGTQVTILASAVDPDNDPLVWSAAGLPDSLTINQAGLISGRLSMESDGTWKVTVNVSDGDSTASGSFTIRIGGTNRRPKWTIPPQDRSDAEGAVISGEVKAVDPDGDAISYFMYGQPKGTGIDKATGKLAGTLDYKTFGEYYTVVTVKDAVDSLSATFKWRVTQTNQIPNFAEPLSYYQDKEGVKISRAFPATDPDAGDLLTYSYRMTGKGSSIPFLTFDSTRGQFSGTISFEATGLYNVTMYVRDRAGAVDSIKFNWQIRSTNRKPVFNQQIPAQSSMESDTPNLQVMAEDPDGNPMTYFATSLPSGVNINSTTGLISGFITYDDVIAAVSGMTTHTVGISVTDGDSTATMEFTWVVSNTNRPPILSTAASVTTYEDTPVGPVTVSVTDPDGFYETLRLSATSGNLSLIPAANIQVGGSGTTWSLNLTPAPDQNGQADIGLVVTDGGLTAGSSVRVNVLPVNDAPVISSIVNQTTNEDVSTAAISFAVSDIDDAANTLTLSAASSSPALVPVGNIAFGGSGNNRTVTILPAQDQNGSATLTVTVTDLSGAKAISNFVLTVNPVNDAPTISDVTDKSTNEDVSTGAISFTIADVDNAVNTLTLSASSSNTTLVPVSNITFGGSAGNRTVTIQPAQDQTGTSTITIITTDPGGLTTSDSFVLAVNAGNDPPTISDIPDQSTDEDVSTGAIGFTVADLDNATSGLTLSATSSNTSLVPVGSITFGGSGSNRTVTIMPAKDQNGTTTIEITVTDPSGGVVKESFVLTVRAVNDAPTISDIPNQSTSEDSSTGVISFTIVDVDNAAHTLTLGATSSNPTLVPVSNITFGGSAGNRTVTIQPALYQSGTTTIEITVTDAGGLTAKESFVLTVTAAISPPTISNITDKGTNEDISTGAISFTIGDLDNAVSTLTLSAASSNTTLVPVGNITFGGSAGNRTVTIQPAANQNGTSTIEITVTDPNGLTAKDSFLLTVNAVNDAPTISDIPNQSTSEDVSTAAISFTVSDVDNASNTLTLSATSSNTTVVPTTNITLGGSGTNRTVTIQPAQDQTGTSTIEITVTDAGGLTDKDSFVLTVTAANDLPVISDISNQSTNEDVSTGAISFTISDPDNAANTLTLSATSSNTGLVPVGNITFGGSAGNRTVTILPAQDQTGTSTIEITVTDAGGLTDKDSFVLTVTAVNDPPVISDIGNQSTNEGVSTGAISFTISDPDNAANTLTLSATSSNTTLVPVGNIILGGSAGSRTVTIQPAAGQTGTSTIEITVTDSGGLTDKDSFVLMVNGVYDPPTISDISNQSTSEDVSTGAISFTITDVDNAANTLTLSATSSNTTLVPAANITFGGSGSSRTVMIMPAANQNGTSTIEITVTDPDGLTDKDSFVLTVTAVNDPPVISDIGNQSTNEDVSTGAISFTVADLDNSPNTLTLSATSSNPTLVPVGNISFGGSGANRTVTIQPAAGQSGTSTIEITVRDPGGLIAKDSFVLTVNAVNDPPTMNNIGNTSTPKNTEKTIDFMVADEDTPLNNLTLSGTSNNQALLRDPTIQFSGSGATRTVTLRPEKDQTGNTTDSITVNDGAGGTTTETFTFTVTATR